MPLMLSQLASIHCANAKTKERDTHKFWNDSGQVQRPRSEFGGTKDAAPPLASGNIFPASPFDLEAARQAIRVISAWFLYYNPPRFTHPPCIKSLCNMHNSSTQEHPQVLLQRV